MICMTVVLALVCILYSVLLLNIHIVFSIGKNTINKANISSQWRSGSMKFQPLRLTTTMTYRQNHGQWNVDISPLHQNDWQVETIYWREPGWFFLQPLCSQAIVCWLMRTEMRSTGALTTGERRAVCTPQQLYVSVHTHMDMVKDVLCLKANNL